MTSTATEHLQIARDYLDSIPEAKPRAGTDIYQPTLQSLAAATKHLEAAAKTDPKATLTVDDPNTKQSTTHTLDELRSEALYYEGFAHAHYGLSVSDVEKGVVAIQKAILHKPYSAIYHSQLGYAFLRLGRTDDAHKALEMAAKLNPRDMDNRKLLDGVTQVPILGQPPSTPSDPIYSRVSFWWLASAAVLLPGTIMMNISPSLFAGLLVFVGALLLITAIAVSVGMVWYKLTDF